MIEIIGSEGENWQIGKLVEANDFSKFPRTSIVFVMFN